MGGGLEIGRSDLLSCRVVAYILPESLSGVCEVTHRETIIPLEDLQTLKGILGGSFALIDSIGLRSTLAAHTVVCGDAHVACR